MPRVKLYLPFGSLVCSDASKTTTIHFVVARPALLGGMIAVVVLGVCQQGEGIAPHTSTCRSGAADILYLTLPALI